MNGEVAVEVDDEGVALNLHGVDLEGAEFDFVAGGFAGFGEELADEVGGVDFHLLRELAAQEGHEEEVEFLGFGEVLDAGIAKTDGFTLGVGDHGDIGFGSESDAEAGGSHGLAEAGAGLDVHEDAVVLEGDPGFSGVNEAGGFVVAADVEAVVLRVEELLVEGALESLSGDADFDGVGSGGEGEKGQGQGRELHEYEDKGRWGEIREQRLEIRALPQQRIVAEVGGRGFTQRAPRGSRCCPRGRKLAESAERNVEVAEPLWRAVVAAVVSSRSLQR